MERAEAARVLGVDAGASARLVERAFRARARQTHPDRFPPGSEAWEDAADAMARLYTARDVLRQPAGAGPEEVGGIVIAGRTDAGDRWAWAQDAPPRPDDAFVVDERTIDVQRRRWGFGWGSFLVVCAVGSFAVGATQPTNDALPFWSPALAVTGLVALAIGWRADRRLRG